MLFAQASDAVTWPGAILGIGICAIIGLIIWSGHRRDVDIARAKQPRDPGKKPTDD